MKHCFRATIGFALLCILAPASVPAGVGYLGLYADAQGTSCELYDPGNALITVYVVHKFFSSGDATGSRFRMVSPAGAAWMYLTFNTPFVPIGTADVDLSLGYGQCLTETTMIGSALWFSVSPSPACGMLNMAPATHFATMIATDCNFSEFPINGRYAVVNVDNSCCCDCGATKQSTWGAVKALYR
jgi:hypothetical protein